VHEMQLRTYLRMSGIRVGLLLNFNAPRLMDGLRRYVV
jgi:GxxExxY protein